MIKIKKTYPTWPKETTLRGDKFGATKIVLIVKFQRAKREQIRSSYQQLRDSELELGVRVGLIDWLRTSWTG